MENSEKKLPIAPSVESKNHEYVGGYFGEVASRKEPGVTPHHIPSNSAINIAIGFTGTSATGEKEGNTNGWTPAILMDSADHELTSSYQNTEQSREYQETQAQLIKDGKMAEALKMDIDDIKRIQKEKNLGRKYDKGMYEAIYNLYNMLKMSDKELSAELPDYAKHPVLIKSRNNPENITLAEKMLKEIGYV